MRKVIASLFTTVDGVVEAPEKWHFPYFNEEMGAVVEAQMSDTQLLGRKSYDTFAATWPQREAAGGDDAPLAARIGDTRKIVVSNQPLDFSWRNSEQLEGDLVEAVIALKNEPGGDIAISGSVSIVRQLLDAGLIDELHLLVDPIAVRDGMRLFDGRGTTLPLTLISSHCLHQRRPAPRLRPGRGRARRHLPGRVQGHGRSQPAQLNRCRRSSSRRARCERPKGGRARCRSGTTQS